MQHLLNKWNTKFDVLLEIKEHISHWQYLDENPPKEGEEFLFFHFQNPKIDFADLEKQLEFSIPLDLKEVYQRAGFFFITDKYGDIRVGFDNPCFDESNLIEDHIENLDENQDLLPKALVIGTCGYNGEGVIFLAQNDKGIYQLGKYNFQDFIYEICEYSMESLVDFLDSEFEEELKNYLDDSQFKLLSKEKANELYQLNDYVYDNVSLEPQLIFFHKGDMLIEGNLNFNWFLKHSYTSFSEYPDALESLLIIDGNLTVKGKVEDMYNPCLLVTGNVISEGGFEDLWKLESEQKPRQDKPTLNIAEIVAAIDKNVFTQENFKRAIGKIPFEQKAEFIKSAVQAKLFSADCTDGMTVCHYNLLYWIESNYQGTKKEKLALGKMVAQNYGLSVKGYQSNSSIAAPIKSKLLKVIQKYF